MKPQGAPAEIAAQNKSWEKGLSNIKVCLWCGDQLPMLKTRFGHYKRGRKYCCVKCRKAHDDLRYKDLNPAPSVSTPTRGTISELIVATDLLTRGFAVFRSMSPSCECDLAILRGRDLLWVEVTTGTLGAHGKIVYPSKNPAKYDVLAVVIKDDRAIRYLPELPMNA